MDDQRARDHITQHAEAVVRGDIGAVVEDFSTDLRPHVPELVQGLPQPVTSADVVSVESGETETVAMIRYAGDTRAVTVRSRWQDEDGRPVIVHAEPVE
jgi:hypothetical protein